MGRTWLVPVLLLVWVGGADAAEACGCAPRSARCGPPAQFWKTAAVFAGRVTSIDRVAGSNAARRVRVRVLEGFRGTATPNRDVDLFTGAVCGYPFKSGREYMIYAARQEDGTLTATACSRTALLERAVDDVTYARQAGADAPPGRILGEVRRLAEYGSPARTLPGIAVALTRIGTRLTTISDERGRYAFDAPGSGAFVVSAELPDTLYSPQSERRVELTDPRGCVEVNIDTRFNGQLTGRVVDATGRAVAGLTVSHTPSSSRRGEVPAHTGTLTRDDGSFRLERLPPGPFVLAVEGMAEDRGTLRGGERLSLQPLRLPDTVSLVHLHGTVHTTDGVSAAGARVFLKEAAEDGRILGEPAVADALGRFVLAVREGERYLVFAEGRGDSMTSSNPAFSVPVVIDALAGMPPLRLTVRRGL